MTMPKKVEAIKIAILQINKNYVDLLVVWYTATKNYVCLDVKHSHLWHH